MSTLDDLKAEANDLGISYNKRIGEKKLQQRIEDHYAAQETSGPAVQKAVEAKEKASKTAETKKLSEKDAFAQKRMERERVARQTRVITIIDNDQRINNHTTTCIVNCSNAYFDLGTKVLPLNEKIEVAQGHINVLKSVQIPLHVKNTQTGLSSVRLRPRYTINYEDM